MGAGQPEAGVVDGQHGSMSLRREGPRTGSARCSTVLARLPQRRIPVGPNAYRGPVDRGPRGPVDLSGVERSSVLSGCLDVTVRSSRYGHVAGPARRAVGVRRNPCRLTSGACGTSAFFAAWRASWLRPLQLVRALSPLRGFTRRPPCCRSAIPRRPNAYVWMSGLVWMRTGAWRLILPAGQPVPFAPSRTGRRAPPRARPAPRTGARCRGRSGPAVPRSDGRKRPASQRLMFKGLVWKWHGERASF